MKWPEQKTRWSFVTRTWYRSALMASPRAELEGRRDDTLAQRHEQGRGHEVGGAAGVAAVAVLAQPGVERGDVGPGHHVGGPPADFLCLSDTAAAGDVRVRVGREQPQVTANDRGF